VTGRKIKVISDERKKKVAERVKMLRIEMFGEGKGAQIAMARLLNIPYTTYRGYEANRFNIDFLILLAKKTNRDISWFLCYEMKFVPGFHKK